MITQTNPTSPPVRGGLIVDTYVYNVRSFRLQKVLASASMMCLALLECRSNNTSNSVSARDSANFQLALADILRDLDWAKLKRNDPAGLMERVYSVQFPRDNELQGMRNVKLQSVAFELNNFFHVLLGTQDLDHGIWIGAETDEDITTAFKTLSEITAVMLGDGKADANGSFNVGVRTASYAMIGMVNPPIISPTVTAQEPSSDLSPSVIPDAADITSGDGGNATATNPAAAPRGGASA
jgi:hypothetical protein